MRVSRVGASSWSLGLLLALGTLSGLDAHHASRAKTLQIRLTESGVDLEIYLSLSEKDLAHDLRQRFDSDADGYLSDREREELQGYAVRRLMTWPRLEIDGRAMEWVMGPVVSRGLDDPVASHYPIELRIGAHTRHVGLGRRVAVLLADQDTRFGKPIACQVLIPEDYTVVDTKPPGVAADGTGIGVEFGPAITTLTLRLQRR